MHQSNHSAIIKNTALRTIVYGKTNYKNSYEQYADFLSKPFYI